MNDPDMPEAACHLWLTPAPDGGQTTAGAAFDPTAIGVPLVPAVDANRRLRGPYTAAGSIMRHLFSGPLRHAGLAEAHALEILSVAPELSDVITAPAGTLTSLAVPEERTRLYAAGRTERLSHGLAELIRDFAALRGAGRCCLAIENISDADPTDQELVAILLRRLDPQLVTLVISTPGAAGGPEAGTLSTGLQAALEQYARPLQVHPAEPAPGAGPDGTQPLQLAAAYVASHCTAGIPALREAYQALDDAQRRRLHDAQADALEAAGEDSLRLGAIPFHCERGSDPSGRGERALARAVDYCVNMGFYDATADLARRARAVIDWQDSGLYWHFTTKMTVSLAALGHPEQALALYDEARALHDEPLIRIGAAYATAMLYTRHFEDGQRDHEAALEWINAAITMSAATDDPKERAFRTVFNQNGKALIDAHQGRPEEALRLVTEGIARLDRELAPDEHLLHRSVLVHNQAQVLAGLGRLEEALASYNAVIARDPHYDEYYFDRAAILRRLGRHPEALADYDTAIRLSPPFAEFHYNRADLRAENGDTEGAMADFSRVIELDPGHLDAHVNRGALHAEAGNTAAARADATAGLALSPGNPHLLCLLGQTELAAGQAGEARRAFDAAVAADPSMPQSWAGRAETAFATGDLDQALADLSRSLDLADDPAVFFNRGVIHEALGQWDQAAADHRSALGLAPGDADAEEHLAACTGRLASTHA
jgi:tetratricopeptide (TPR) repeat protein